MRGQEFILVKMSKIKSLEEHIELSLEDYIKLIDKRHSKNAEEEYNQFVRVTVAILEEMKPSSRNYAVDVINRKLFGIRMNGECREAYIKKLRKYFCEFAEHLATCHYWHTRNSERGLTEAEISRADYDSYINYFPSF